MLSRSLKGKSYLKYALLSPIVIGGGYYFSDETRRRQTLKLAHATYRITNLIGTVSIMVMDYTYNLYYKYAKELEDLSLLREKLKRLQQEQETYLINYHQPGLSPQEKQDWLTKITENSKIMNGLSEQINLAYKKNKELFYEALHHRNGVRLKEMCEQNGGLYIKLGQHLAMLDHVLPMEYQDSLVNLLSNTPQSSYESIERIFQEDFHDLKPTDLFDSMSLEPIASASLAQVHIAYKDHKKYAVKVQHEGLQEGSAADRLVITKIVTILSHYFKEFNYNWLTEEMNKNLPLELDFSNEFQNMLTITKDLQPLIKAGDVAVPTPIAQYSSKRILTMTFEEGYYLNNIPEMEKMHLQKIDISTLVSKIFSQQIFRYGFVHCDPHEANLLFRKHPTKQNKPQIVLLDHGLYRKLDETFRKDYCRLWQAIILADTKGIEEYGKRLNAGSAYPLLAAILTLKPWDTILSADPTSNLSNSNTNAKKASDLILLQSYARLYYQEIVDLLASVPSDLLLLFKTNDCLRHLDKLLNTPVNSTAVVAKEASNVILQEEFQEIFDHWDNLNSISKGIGIFRRWLIIMSRVFLFSNVVYYGNKLQEWYDYWLKSYFSISGV